MSALQEPLWRTVNELPQGLPTDNPNAMIWALLKSMNQICCEKLTNCHFVGQWEIFIHGLLCLHLDLNHYHHIQIQVFRDEYLDTKTFTVGKSGWWLRRRTFANETPKMTLKYHVNTSKGVMQFEEEHDVAKIQQVLHVEDVEVSHHFVVAWYDCVRISYKDPSGSCAYIDVARIADDKFYLLATAEPQLHALDSESVSVDSRSKLLDALDYQNNKYYQYLAKSGHIREHLLDEYGMAHIECPSSLKSIFQDFAVSFEDPLSGSD